MVSAERGTLQSFRRDLYATFERWGDALFELADALMCTSGPVTSLPALSLEPEFSRSHGSLYKALERGRIDEDALRSLLVANRPDEWPMVFAVDASTVERCDAECSPERGFYYSASRHSAGQPIVAGWHYQWICQLSWAPDSWTAPVDVLRLPLSVDETTATVSQLRWLVALLPSEGEVPLFVLDAGYDPIGIGHDLRGERCEIVCRVRDDRVFYADAPAKPNRPPETGGRPPRHGRRWKCSEQESWPTPDAAPRPGRLPLRDDHRHRLARHAPAPIGSRPLGRVREAADRARLGDPRRRRTPAAPDVACEKDVVAVVVRRR
jgi:hypothetical protein